MSWRERVQKEISENKTVMSLFVEMFYVSEVVGKQMIRALQDFVYGFKVSLGNIIEVGFFFASSVRNPGRKRGNREIQV